MSIVLTAVLLGMGVMLAGTLPRNLLFLANLEVYSRVPWSLPILGLYLWLLWRWLGGHGPPAVTATRRRKLLRAHRIPARTWVWALAAGIAGLVALVLALRLVNRMVVLPQQAVPDLSHIPWPTLIVLFSASALIAGVVEEAAFRGYMQGPIERRWGLPLAILVTGTMFAVAHLDFELRLWPYYVAVAALYGTVTSLAGSILPAIVLHTLGNLYSNFTLILTGQAEWQAARSAQELIWQRGADGAFWQQSAAFAGAAIAMLLAFRQLARLAPRAGPRREGQATLG